MRYAYLGRGSLLISLPASLIPNCNRRGSGLSLPVFAYHPPTGQGQAAAPTVESSPFERTLVLDLLQNVSPISLKPTTTLLP